MEADQTHTKGVCMVIPKSLFEFHFSISDYSMSNLFVSIYVRQTENVQIKLMQHNQIK